MFCSAYLRGITYDPTPTPVPVCSIAFAINKNHDYILFLISVRIFAIISDYMPSKRPTDVTSSATTYLAKARCSCPKW
jgi:hypothetical protein